MYLKLPQIPFLLGNRLIARDHLRRLLVEEHEVDRTLFKAMTSDKTLPMGIRLQVQRLFETEMPKDAHPTRVVNRCVLTGRARGVHRFARMSRIMIRQLVHYGHMPGVSKASW